MAVLGYAAEYNSVKDLLNFMNFSIHQKYWLSLGVVCTLFVLLIFLSIHYVSDADKRINEGTNRVEIQLMDSMELASLAQRLSTLLARHELKIYPSSHFQREFESVQSQLILLQKKVSEYPTDSENVWQSQTLLLDSVERLYTAMGWLMKTPISKDGSTEALTHHQLEMLLNRVDETLSQFVSAQQALLKQQSSNNLQLQQQARKQLYWLLLGALILMALMVFVFHKKVFEPVTSISALVSELAVGEGDLTKRITLTNDAELDGAAEQLNQLMGQLQNLVAKISEEADSYELYLSDTASALEQVEVNASICSNLSQLAMKQSSHNVDASVQLEKQSQVVAEEISSVSVDADLVAERVKESVKASVELLDEVKRLRDHVEYSDDVIHGLANLSEMFVKFTDQTDLMALNAAIESARAGYEGRKFLELAQEYRVLAEKSRTSSIGISNTIRETIQSSGRTLEQMEVTLGVAESINRKIHLAQDQVYQMQDLAQQLKQLVEMISTAQLSQRKSNQEIQVVGDRLQQIADETADKVELVDSNVKRLLKSLKNIHRHVKQFRI